ncbi:ATP synthase F(1) complex subunit gamma, mitochondrial-like [Babylonia areolata]|uniref:ATP synthase F(1) complex subunit gamma, mitochondrial-like n=1 Tax=Babylonia areolata TaxID=304850 RepID=UPI003FD6A771
MEAIVSRTVAMFTPQVIQVRGMATLKEIRLRLKSINNIQKITKSMKMVSAAKYARAERELKPARSYGVGAKTFFERMELEQDKTQPSHLFVVMSSDRGLCGGIHSGICRELRALLNERTSGIERKLIIIGDKARSILQRGYKDHFLMTFNDFGRKSPVFADAALVANAILDLDFKFDVATLFFNTFRSVVAFRLTELPLFSQEQVAQAEKLHLYDSIDDEVLRSYNEFALASLLLFAMKEGACSEQSSRMTAMDAASKNAGEMIDKLTLTFNRTRQAVITKELIEIISGANAI